MMNETSRPDKPVMIYRKTAILQKNGIFAAVGVYSYLGIKYYRWHDTPAFLAAIKSLSALEEGE